MYYYNYIKIIIIDIIKMFIIINTNYCYFPIIKIKNIIIIITNNNIT